MAETDQDYIRILSGVTNDFQHTYRSVFKAVRQLSLTDIMQAATLEERLQSLDLLTVSVGNLPEVSGLQVCPVLQKRGVP